MYGMEIRQLNPFIGEQEATEAKARAEVSARRADKMLAVARKAAGEVHAARALADAERAEKAEYQSAKERVRNLLSLVPMNCQATMMLKMSASQAPSLGSPLATPARLHGLLAADQQVQI